VGTIPIGRPSQTGKLAHIGQTRSGLIEDALIVAAGAAVVALSTRRA